MIKRLICRFFVKLFLVVVVFGAGFGNFQIRVGAIINCGASNVDKNSQAYKDQCASKTNSNGPADPAAQKSVDDLKKAEEDNAKAKAEAQASTPQIKSLQYQSDARIGSLAQCNYQDSAAIDSAGGNRYLADCLKNIMQLIVSISVILAVMSLVWLGIRSLNSFDDQASINKEISERIKGFVIGAVILGLFTAIIQTINPSALRIDQIFSANVVNDIRSQTDAVKPFGRFGGDSGQSGTGAGAPVSAGVNGGSGSGSNTNPPVNIAQQISDTGNDPAKKEALAKQYEPCEQNYYKFVSEECSRYLDTTSAEQRKQIFTGTQSTGDPKNKTLSGSNLAFRFPIRITAISTSGQNTSSFATVSGSYVSGLYAGNITFEIQNCPNSPFLQSSVKAGTTIEAGAKPPGDQNSNCSYIIR